MADDKPRFFLGDASSADEISSVASNDKLSRSSSITSFNGILTRDLVAVCGDKERSNGNIDAEGNKEHSNPEFKHYLDNKIPLMNAIYYNSPTSPLPYLNLYGELKSPTEPSDLELDDTKLDMSKSQLILSDYENAEASGSAVGLSSLFAGASSIVTGTIQKVDSLVEKGKNTLQFFIHGPLTPSASNIRYFKHLLQAAGTYEQWHSAAHQLDRLEGRELWKELLESKDYDYELVRTKLQELRKARESGDVVSMMFLLRTTISRNLGDMGNPKLYSKTLVGTKKLIEDYNDEVIRHCMAICDAPEVEGQPITMLDGKLEFFLNTRQAFGRTALLLSGGATLGLYHVGVVKALHESKLLPRIISGSSIGSLIAALVCTKTDKELFTFLRDDSLNLNALESEDEIQTLFFKINRLVQHGVIFDVEVLKECIRSNIGDITFQEAYNRTRRILNITVSSSTQFEMPRLLNYLTAPNVIIWSAVAASCAIPFFYKSAPLVARDKFGKIVPWNPSGHKWIDGSVENDLPMTRLSELFNVNHFIVCQVNPHVLPFLLGKQFLESFKTRNRLFSSAFYLTKTELQHRINQLIELDVFPTVLHRTQNILSQKYSGDITIIPYVNYKDYFALLTNPTKETLWDALIRGESATWPKMNIIKNHCQIELLLDRVIYRLRCRKLDEAVMNIYPSQHGQSQTGTPDLNYILARRSSISKYGSYNPAKFSANNLHVPSDQADSPSLAINRSLSVGRMMDKLNAPPLVIQSNVSPQISSTGSLIGLSQMFLSEQGKLADVQPTSKTEESTAQSKPQTTEEKSPNQKSKTKKGKKTSPPKISASLLSSLTITPLKSPELEKKSSADHTTQ